MLRVCGPRYGLAGRSNPGQPYLTQNTKNTYGSDFTDVLFMYTCSQNANFLYTTDLPYCSVICSTGLHDSFSLFFLKVHGLALQNNFSKHIYSELAFEEALYKPAHAKCNS